MPDTSPTEPAANVSAPCADGRHNRCTGRVRILTLGPDSRTLTACMCTCHPWAATATGNR